jgi:hypothetical protein
LVKTRRLALAAAIAVAVTLVFPATALATTTASGIAQAPSAASTYVPAFNPKIAKCAKTATAGTAEHCTRVQQIPLKDLTSAQRAERQRDMARLAARAKASRNTSVPAQAAVTAPAQCNFSSTQDTLTGISNPSRFVSCSDVLWTVVTTTIEDGVPIITGFFQFEDQSWNLYSVSSLGWEHGMQTLGYTGAFGTQLANGFSGTLESNCTIDTQCEATSLTVNPDPQPVSIAPGGTYSFDWAESDLGPATTTAGSVDTLDPFLGVTWEVLSIEPPTQGTESGDLAARCDSAFTNSSGCVDEGFIPTLFLSLAKYGAAAAMVQFAQDNMTAHWGKQGEGSPLTRLAAGGSANRAVICDSTFVSQGTAIGGNDGDKDSCDEFPFAATYQSGVLNGVTSGAQCAQVTATPSGGPTTGNEAADWPTVAIVGTPTLNESCVRGHIPLNLNTAAGGAYGGLITSNRLLDADPFWVSVTA